MVKTGYLFTCFLIVLALGAPLPATAGESDRLQLADLSLPICGQGLLEWAGFLDIYTARFYLEETTRSSWPALAGASSLSIDYHHGFTRDELIEAGEKVLERQLSEAELARLRERIDRLHQAYRSVGPGDRYRLSYLPQRGLELEFNGEVLIALEGEELARAIFGIWLGDKDPLAPQLRDQLLSCLDEEG